MRNDLPNLKSKPRLITGPFYRGYPVMQDKGPFLSQYLDRIISVLEDALKAHPRTFAVRCDLRIPQTYTNLNEHRLVDRFVSSLKEKEKWSRRRAARTAMNGRVHRTDVRYIWAREIGQRGRPHYHFVLLLNHDAYRVMGKYEVGRDNLYNRILEAWASALKIDVEDAEGLVQMPKNATYRIDVDDKEGQDGFFYRASYLAKSATKVLGPRHSFGSSRRSVRPRWR